MLKELDEKEAIDLFYKGLAGWSMQRLELLTIACQKGEDVDLVNLIARFSLNLPYKWLRYRCEYFGVIVGGQHCHLIWKKPFIKFEDMKQRLDELSGNRAFMWNRTIRGDKDSKRDMRKLVQYLINQAVSHTEDGKAPQLLYTWSVGWFNFPEFKENKGQRKLKGVGKDDRYKQFEK